MAQKIKTPVPTKIALPIIAIVILGFGIFFKLTLMSPNEKQQVPDSGNISPTRSNQIIKVGNPANTNFEKVIFNGCGTQLSNYSYLLQLPGNWTISKRTIDSYSTYYDAKGDNETFTVSCTTQGVGSDMCDEKNLKNFTVNGQVIKACYGQVNGTWNLGVLNLQKDATNNSTISFWAQGLDINMLNKIFSSFKILTNK